MAEAEHPGLGTGATMAAIVETLVRRNYIERSSEKKKRILFLHKRESIL